MSGRAVRTAVRWAVGLVVVVHGFIHLLGAALAATAGAVTSAQADPAHTATNPSPSPTSRTRLHHQTREPTT